MGKARIRRLIKQTTRDAMLPVPAPGFAAR